MLKVNADNEYKAVERVYSGSTEIDKILDKNGNVLFAVNKEVEGTPALTYKGKEETNLKNYRIYGNTVNGESIGDLITEGEHAGEYRVPVTVEGKNLFDNSKTVNILNCYLSVSTLVSRLNTRTVFIECKPSTTYTVSKIRREKFVVGWSDKLPAPGVELQEKVINYKASSITITTGLTAKYLVAYIYDAELDAPITADEMIASVQIEKGSTATPYEPYHAPVTTPIYLPEQIKMVGDEAEYVDYKEQKQHRVRKNLWSGVVEQGGVSQYGNYSSDSKRIRSKNVPIEPGTYMISSNLLMRTIYAYNDDQNIGVCLNTGYGVYSQSFTVPAGANNIAISMMKRVDGVQVDITPSDFEWGQIEKGSEATTYEPYITNTELDVTLPALPTLSGTNTLSVGTEVQPSNVYLKGRIREISV